MTTAPAKRNAPVPALPGGETVPDPGPEQIPLPLGMRSEPSLENFIPGPNREAREAIKKIADGMGERVIYLWGIRGTGKSHLLAAARRGVARRDRKAVSLSYRTSPSIRASIIDGIQKITLICIDDIDAKAGYKEWEETLFYLYNLAEASGTRLLVAGEQNPTGAGFSSPDLRSRLSAALVLRLHPLDDDGRRMALKCRAREWGFTLSDRVIAFLLRRCQRDMHSLFALLEKIDQGTLVEKRRVTIPFVRNLLTTSAKHIESH
uniref:Regulatory inactivation of DnaA Hda protein n=1 Tax=Candidatus Kentrum sp. SD TaxID=2126332 RepID=A0A450YFJ2_9GAMM|nr:MAG: regulatory inactivation of DnaA Hda protein [Candidatus Kentron sp. SD]VFK40253.1 MAG: regulatory inactivation of DnaA Hda protein [Candidatus Kentron sp. SD]VFK78576.1 MAG: regulatory inactivation of DnaA Hda protein [Candidatus Kentron sp. SD]